MPTDQPMASPHAIVNGQAVCTATEGTFCRMECPEGTCEEWRADGCEHGPLVDSGHCLAAEWVNAVGLADTGPEDAPEGYEGPAVIEWGAEGEGYTWAPLLTSTRMEATRA